MLGYKIYFNGEMFIFEDHLSLIEENPSSNTTRWASTIDVANNVCNDLNKHLKSNINELKNSDDIVVIKCKECNDYFIMSKSRVDWYMDHNYDMPKNCYKCMLEFLES